MYSPDVLTSLIRLYKHSRSLPEPNVVTTILSRCEGVIRCVAHSQDASPVGERTVIALEKAGVSDRELQQRDRDTLAQSACFLVIARYFQSDENVMIWKYISKYTPRVYATLIKGELEGVRTGYMGCKDADLPEYLLPIHGQDYVETVLQGNIAGYSREYFPFISRSNIHRLFRDL